jgi:hypothetical protein
MYSKAGADCQHTAAAAELESALAVQIMANEACKAAEKAADKARAETEVVCLCSSYLQ